MSFTAIIGLAALGGLLFGYDTGVISSALLFIKQEFQLSTGGESLVAAIVLLGAVIGASVALLTVTSLCAYVAFFAIGLGPIFWLLIAEIFPLRVRGRAMSLATISNWGFNLIVTISFLGLIETLGRPGAFGLYLILTLAAFVFAWRLVPETKGRSLEEIEAALEGETEPRAKEVIRSAREQRESA